MTEEDRNVYQVDDVYDGPSDQRIHLRPDEMTMLEMVDQYHSLLASHIEPQNVSSLIRLFQMHLSYIIIHLLCTAVYTCRRGLIAFVWALEQTVDEPHGRRHEAPVLHRICNLLVSLMLLPNYTALDDSDTCANKSADGDTESAMVLCTDKTPYG